MKKRLFMLSTSLLFMGITASAQSPANDNCASAQLINEGPNCVRGTTVGSTIEPLSEPDPSTGTNGCWASARNATVWYYFTVDTPDVGVYTLSTDNGVGELGQDMQLALYKSTSGCTFDVTFNGGKGFYCSEDQGDPDNGNAFAGEITANLGAGTYYVQVDRFGNTQGEFCLSLTKNVKPINDLVTAAIDISSLISGISMSNPMASASYIYNAPSDTISPAVDDGPTLDIVPTSSSNCNGSAAGIDSFYGIWFKFTKTSAMRNSYLNVFPSNGANYYVATLFSGTPSVSSTGAITGITSEACSAGDNGLPNNGGYSVRDKSNTNISGHPRLNISGLTDDSTYYVLVNQYPRVTVGTTGPGTIAPPSDGIINLVIEADSVAGTSIDTVTADVCANAMEIGCPNSIANFSATYTGLTNAGLSGNISAVQGGRNATPKTDEPLEFVFNGGSGTFQENCQLPNFVGAALERFNNNSGVYKFTLAGATSTSTAIPDTLLSITINDTLIVIDTITVVNPLGPIEVVVVDTIINVLPAAPCGADVRVTLNNIVNKGVNGASAEIFILSEDGCSGSSLALMGAETTSDDDQCISIATTAGALPPGTYYIWVDGADGQVLTYDLTLDINYFVPGTIVECGVSCGSPKTTTVRTIQAPGFILANIRPMPVANSMFVDYKLDQGNKVEIQIFDLSGRLMKTQQNMGMNGMNSVEVSTQDLPEGMYIINLISGNQKIRSKFTKVASN
jgi:hypothetical protein